MKVKVLQWKDGRVDVALRAAPSSFWSYQDPGSDTVYWSPQKFRQEQDRDGKVRVEPAGGFNSFVCVADPERGFWVTEDGQRVTLVSINGIGEVRWRIDGPHMEHYAEGSIEHFGLKRFAP